MQLNSATCRAQEARQREIAEHAPLANVRGIASRAAAAWATEAVLARKRENRAVRVEIIVATLPSNGARPFDDRIFSENPDRGCADE